MVRWLPLLLLCTYACAARKLSCDWYPSAELSGKCMQCSGEQVKEVPVYVPNTLEVLLMTGTAVSFLDSSSFEKRHLTNLTTLHVTEGSLASVSAGAFCSLPKLERLHLDHNQLEFVDALSFNCSQHLKVVSLEGNPTLRHLPPLFSSSVERLYLDDCRLESFDVATVEGMTALEVLSLIGNTDIHCPTLKSQFKQVRPNLKVDCEQTAVDDPSPVFPGDQEITTEKSLTEAHYTATNEEKKVTNNEELTTEASNIQPHLTTKDEKEESTADAASIVGVSLGTISGVVVTTNREEKVTNNEESTTEASNIQPDCTTKDEKEESTVDNASGVGVTLGAIAGVVAVVALGSYIVYRRRNSISQSRSDDPSEQPLRQYP